MTTFFEKLKKGMGIEIPLEEKIEKKPEEPAISLEEKPKKAKREKLEVKVKPIEPGIEKPEEKVKKPPLVKVIEEKEKKWFEPEGQLAIDVYQTEKDLVIQSAIAGVRPEDLEIFIEGDRILIKGKREKPAEKEERNYFYQECYWGPFSREIILPVETDPSRAEAAMKEGILTIRIPKIEREKKRRIEIKA